MGQDKEYYAFISYKREDEKWAKWLQHKLEHYKLPSNLNGRTDLPREIRPVFRDTSELNPGNLPQQIHDALAASKHLIVICSPRSAHSEWVNKEIETFIAMGKRDCIIPFIIDGRPYVDDSSEECFPSAIRNLPKEQELLGANITEMGRDAAAVKTVAQMFGVRFDTLWKRYEREQRRKRVLSIMAVALFVLAVLGIAAYIWRQNVIITKSRTELQLAYDNLTIANRATEREKNRAVQAEHNLSNANDSIKYQYDIIERTNADLFRTINAKSLAQSRAAAEVAMELIDNNNSLDARKVALAALDIAYTPEAEKALRCAYYQNSGMILGHTDSVNSSCFNADGSLIVSASSDKTIKVWDASSMKELYSLVGHTGAVMQAVFSPNGNNIASASADGTVRIWNTQKRICEKILTEHKSLVRGVAYNSGGNLLMSETKNEIIIRNIKNYAIIKHLDFGEKEMFAMFHPNGDDIVIVQDRNIQIKNIYSDKLIYSIDIPNSLIEVPDSWISEYKYPINNVSISPNGKFIICSDNHFGAYFVNIEKDTMITFPVGHTSSNNSIAIGIDGNAIAISSKTGEISIWNSSNTHTIAGHLGYEKTKQYKVKGGERILLSYSPNGNQLVAALSDGSIYLWCMYPMVKEVVLDDGESIGMGFYSSNTIVMPDNTVITASPDIYIWDFYSGKKSSVVKANCNRQHSISLSNDGDYLALSPQVRMVSFDKVRKRKGGVFVYNLREKKLKRTFDSSSAVAFSPNNKWLACSQDNVINIYNAKTYALYKVLFGCSDHIYDMAFSPNSSELVSVSLDGTIKLWDINFGRCLGNLNYHYRKGIDIYNITYSPTGEFVASIFGNKIILWDAKSGKQIRMLEGHLQGIENISFSPDGHWIVSTSLDGTIKVWNVQTGMVMSNLRPRYVRYYSTFSKKGDKIISILKTGKVEIYDFPSLVELINATRERFKDAPLTQEERRRYYLE